MSDQSRSRSPERKHANGNEVDESSKHRKSHHHRRSKDSRSRSRSYSPKRHSGSGSHRKRHRRSRSPSHGRHSRSRSRSYSPRRRSRSGSYRPNLVPADGPPPNRCIGVFGMSLYTDEKTLNDYFAKFGKIENIQLVYDKQTNRSRGFGFIYFDSIEDATRAKDRSAGVEIDGHRIRVDFSITKRPHTPTPGIYMGKRKYGSRRDDNYGRGRSRSPYYSRRGRSRSRSYSYSPQRRR